MSNWKLISQKSLFIHFLIIPQACIFSLRFRRVERSQHSLLTHWFPTPVAAFCASPLISNDFVENPFQSIAGVRPPAAHPHGRADPQGAQTPLRQRPKKGVPSKPFYSAHPFWQGIATLSGSFLAGVPAPAASLCSAVPDFPPFIPSLESLLSPRVYLVVAQSSHCSLATLPYTILIPRIEWRAATGINKTMENSSFCLYRGNFANLFRAAHV